MDHFWFRPQGAGSTQRGFTLIELAIAMIVMLVGAVAVMQLVPAAIQTNLYNRVDTSSVVIAQREMDQMIDQPFSSTSFLDIDGNTCDLGDPTQPNMVVGSSVVMNGGKVAVDYSASKVNGYNLLFTNPQDPTDGAYDVRWAVVTQKNSLSMVSSKRFIVGVQRVVGKQLLPPVTIDSWQYLER